MKAYLFMGKDFPTQIALKMGRYSDETLKNLKGHLIGIEVEDFTAVGKNSFTGNASAEIDITSSDRGLALQLVDMCMTGDIGIIMPVAANEYVVFYNPYECMKYDLSDLTLRVTSIGPHGIWKPESDLSEWEEPEDGKFHTWINNFY